MKLRPILIDRYVFRSFIVTFVGSCALFVFIVLLFNIMNQLSWFAQRKTPLSVVFEMYFYKSFLQITIVSPAAALFSVIFTINNLAKNSELIAVINSGMSVYRLCMYILLFGFLFSLLMVPFNDHVVFPATKKAEAISDKIRGRYRKPSTDLRLWGRHGLFYKARSYNLYRKELHDLIVLKLRERLGPANGKKKVVRNRQLRSALVAPKKKSQALTKKMFARIPKQSFDFVDQDFLFDVRKYEMRSIWLFRIEARRAIYDLKRKGWVLYDGRIRKYTKRGTLVFPFKKRFFPLPETHYDFSQDYDKVNAMTTAEAARYIRKLQKAGKPYGKEAVEYYLKYSFPLINFIIIMIGISLGGFSSRSVLLFSFFIAVGIYMLYYTFVAIGLSMGKIGLISPAIGAWIGNVAFFLGGLVLLALRKT